MKHSIRLKSWANLQHWLVCFVFFFFSSATIAQNLEVHHINVGQGTSILVVGPDGTTILFDGGNSGKGTNEVIPYLQSLGITTSTALDYMILSHRDADHMIGLTETINAGYDVLAIYDNGSDKTNTSIQNFLSAAATTTAGGVVKLALGTVINLGSGATATCVVVDGDVIGSGAVSGALNNENDRSIGLLIEYGDFDFLASGDLGGGGSDNSCTGRSTSQVNVETPLAQAITPGGANPLLGVDGVEVLHVNHHGSESSTNSDYMNLLNPKVAMISVGAGQSSTWHHPRQDVVDNVLLAQASCINAPSVDLVLQTEEGSPTGSQTSFSGYCVGDIVLTTDGISDYTIDASGAVNQGPNEVAAAGLPVTFPFDETTVMGSDVLFSEIFYDTPGNESQEEWLEIYNNGVSIVDVGGWTITDNNGGGGTYTIPAGNTIAPGTYFTIAKNQGGFQALYGYDADVYGSLPSLNNNGDALILKDGSGQELDAVAWEGGANQGVPSGWGSNSQPSAGGGNSIYRIDPLSDSDTYSDWAIAGNNGDPQTQSTTSIPTIVISEVFYDTPGTDSVEEWVELFNATAATVDIGNWTITDNNGTGATFTIPAGETIAAGTYLTIAINQSGFQALYGYDADVYGAIPALNNTGDALILKDGAGEEIDAVAWEGGATGGQPSGWGSSSDPNAPTGSTIYRSDPNSDSDTFSDWLIAANNGDPQTQTPANVAPIAVVNGPYNGLENQSISFSSAGSNDTDGTIVSYLWDFGDGYSSTNANPSHSYASAGTYTVILTVTDDGSAQGADTTSATITVPSAATVLISEVFYDTPGTDSKEEWVELYNNGSTAVDISGWMITDDNGNGSTYTVPGGNSIAPGTYFTIATQRKGFEKLYGYQADVSGSLPSLNNAGDALILQDAGGSEIDAVAWEGGSSGGLPAGWGSSGDPNAPVGNSIYRTDPNSDSDTYTDWAIAGNNGDPQTQSSSSSKAIAAASVEDTEIILRNYPNPFNPATHIEFSVRTEGSVKLTVYNILGQAVQVLVNEYKSSGVHTVRFDGTGLASGLYFYQLRTADGIKNQRMMLTR